MHSGRSRQKSEQTGISQESANQLTDEDRRRSESRDLHDLRSNFDALMVRYSSTLYNVIYRLIGDAEEASDITQETFLSAYKASKAFRGEARVYTWLYRIAINNCKNRFKQRDRLREHDGGSLDSRGKGDFSDDDDGSLYESALVADWTSSPQRVLEQNDLRDLIYKAVDSLPPEYRVVLVLREMEQMNYSDIVEATGLSMEAVKTRISRGRAMVRRKIEPYYRSGS